MLRLRPYKACDAKAIVSWIGDETMFRKWCADRFESWPITAEDLNRHYEALADSDSFYEMTACSPGIRSNDKTLSNCVTLSASPTVYPSGSTTLTVSGWLNVS